MDTLDKLVVLILIIVSNIITYYTLLKVIKTSCNL